MYAPFFGLTQAPFSIAPDPHMLFMSKRHREALAHLLYGVGGGDGNASGAGGGFVLLTGEIGTGKTTVCRCFLEQIPSSCNVAYIFNPKLTVIELLQSICDEFRIPSPAYRVLPTIKDYIDPLNAFLLQAHGAGRNNVLIIDEAQNLSADVLEQLRLLTNLETSERKLLQIILIGQPKLRAKLQMPELEQLAQRVIARYHLEALTEAETAQYVQHRLEVSGLKGAVPFDRKALRRIHQVTKGVPRRINLLCDRALLGGFAGGHAVVGERIIAKAASEVFDPPRKAAVPARRWRRSWPMAAAGVLAGAGLVMLIRFLLPLGNWADWPRDESESVAQVAPDGVPTSPTDTPASAAASLSRAANPPEVAASAASPAPALLRDENQAWRELAQAWKVKTGDASPCEALAREQLRCFSTTNINLALVRQLGRPGIVTLDSRSGSPSYALLTHLTADSATLRAGDSEQTVTLAALAARWQGEFSTLWRAPPGYSGRVTDRQLQWVVAELAKLDGSSEPPAADAAQGAAFTARVRAFQLAQGLPADGLLGPMTFMQLNRRIGIDEPVLATGS